MLLEKRSFEGGMDGDTSQRLLPSNVMLNCMNARMGVTEQGRNFRIENILGMTEITNSVYAPYGTNQCIGSCPDLDRNRILFFIYNTFDDHAIFCYDIDSGNTYAVLYDSQVIGGLGFSKTSRIDRNAKVIGDLLYWTDDLNEPRRINIEAGIKMNHASYVTSVARYSYPMNPSVITLIRRPFGLPLAPTKVTDGTVITNFVNTFSGKFATRFIYRDNEYSVFGATSKVINYNFPSDTFNAIDVVYNTNEDIDQDVQIVQMAVSYGGDPSYFIIKQWNKAVSSEAAEIATHNAGGTPLTFRFYNDKTGIAVSDAESVKPFDPIPTKVKTLELATNRLFLSNYLKGYNTPTQTSLAYTLTTSSTLSTNQPSFAPFSTYQIAIRFRDYYKRQSAVVTNENLIVTIADRDTTGIPYTTLINWTVSNALATTEIPDWAYYYDILITKNLTKRFFLQYISGYYQYVSKDANGNYVYAGAYNTSVYGLAVNISLLKAKGVGYTFNEGDLLRLYDTSTYELPILAVDGDWVIFKAVDIGNLATTTHVAYYEIYTPYKRLPDEPFYTTNNQSYTITNAGTVSRTYSTTSGTITGDAFWYVEATTLFFFGYVVKWWTMSPNYNYWQDWFGINGEANFETLLGQVDKTNFIQWSNVLIQGSQTNGLSTFDALDEKALPEEMGDINKLQLANKIQEEGNIMLAIGAKATASLYLGEVQLVGASKNAFVASAPSVIGTVNVLKGTYGTVNPESVVEYLGLVFWIDILNGVFVQYSPAGLEPVSRYKQSRFFKNYCQDYLAASTANLDNINGFHHIPTAINPFNKEAWCVLPALIYENYATNLPSYSSVPSYATSIIDRFDIYDQLAKVMSFKFEDNIWGSDFEGIAEQYEYIQNKCFSWKAGVMWSHDTNSTNWNRFYGTDYPVRICTTANYNPSLLKDAANVAIESNAAPDFSVALTNYPFTQITDLASDNYTDLQGQFFATWLGDRLDPNQSGTADQKLFTGSQLTDIAIFTMFEFAQYDSLFYCNFIDIGWEASRGQQRIANPDNK